MKLLNYMLIMIGGSLGAIFRFILSDYISKIMLFKFPIGTFTVNLLGCMIVGIVSGLNFKYTLSASINLLLITGFAGGFTTFSTFCLENLTLIKNSDFTIFIIYCLLSIILGIVFIYTSFYLVTK